MTLTKELMDLRQAHEDSARQLNQRELKEAYKNFVASDWTPNCTDDYEYSRAIANEHEQRNS